MSVTSSPETAPRYTVVPEEKAGGATYTPNILADFVARQIVNMLDEIPVDRPLRVLDPAIGHGELLVSLLRQLSNYHGLDIKVYGFETDRNALNIATSRLRKCFPTVEVNFKSESFITN